LFYVKKEKEKEKRSEQQMNTLDVNWGWITTHSERTKE